MKTRRRLVALVATLLLASTLAGCTTWPTSVCDVPWLYILCF